MEISITKALRELKTLDARILKRLMRQLSQPLKTEREYSWI